MVVPFDHKPDLEVLDPETRAEMMELTTRCMTVLRKLYRPPAFNMGANIGEAAGAGVKPTSICISYPAGQVIQTLWPPLERRVF